MIRVQSPGGVIHISSHRNDQRTFLGVKSFYSGILLGRKIWKVFLGVRVGVRVRVRVRVFGYSKQCEVW